MYPNMRFIASRCPRQGASEYRARELTAYAISNRPKVTNQFTGQIVTLLHLIMYWEKGVYAQVIQYLYSHKQNKLFLSF
jgi:hypothetical protein